jgi:hypothetical protein
MSLANALEIASNNPIDARRGNVVDRVLDELNDEDKAAFLAALKDHSFSSVQLSLVLKNEGHTISDQSIRRWRRINA